MGPDAMILVFWMLSFKSTFSLSSFTFIKRLFSSSLSAIRVMSSVYLRLLILLPAVLVPACASSSPAFCMLYTACKLNNQGDNIQPWRTPFPIWNQSFVPCPVLTVACIQISQEAGKVVWYSHLFKNFLQFVVIHTVKGFGIVNKAEVDVFILICQRADRMKITITENFSILAWEIPWQATVHAIANSQTQLKQLGMYTCTWEAWTPYIAK